MLQASALRQDSAALPSSNLCHIRTASRRLSPPAWNTTFPESGDRLVLGDVHAAFYKSIFRSSTRALTSMPVPMSQNRPRSRHERRLLACSWRTLAALSLGRAAGVRAGQKKSEFDENVRELLLIAMLVRMDSPKKM